MLLLPVLVFSMVAHEYAHAAAAFAQGDDTGYKLGRVTLNPIPHIDPFQSVLLPAMLFLTTGFVFGGAKPVPIDPGKFRRYVWGDLIVSSAGVLTNLGLGLVFTALFVLLHLLAPLLPDALPALIAAQRMMCWGIYLNLLLGIFNLIPIPPLDGSRLFYHLLPARLGAAYRRLNNFGFVPILLLVLFFPAALGVLLTPVRWGYTALSGLVAPFAVGAGWDILQR